MKELQLSQMVKFWDHINIDLLIKIIKIKNLK